VEFTRREDIRQHGNSNSHGARPNHFDDKVDSDQEVVKKKLSLSCVIWYSSAAPIVGRIWVVLKVCPAPKRAQRTY